MGRYGTEDNGIKHCPENLFHHNAQLRVKDSNTQSKRTTTSISDS